MPVRSVVDIAIRCKIGQLEYPPTIANSCFLIVSSATELWYHKSVPKSVEEVFTKEPLNDKAKKIISNKITDLIVLLSLVNKI